MKPFRKTVTRRGKKSKVSTWSIRYRNAEGKRQEEHGFLTEEEAWYRLKEAKKEVEEERLGIRDPRQKNYRMPLIEHLDDFKKALEDEGVSIEQVKLVTGRVRRILDGCGFNFPPDLCPLALKGYLAKLRKDGLSEQTAMHYVRAIKQLTLFLVKHKRLHENPFGDLKFKKEVEKKHPRRALSVAEISRLLDAARQQVPLRGLSGPDRAMLYLTAVQTGFRASELASLTVGDLNLDQDPAVAVLDGSRTKNGEEAKIPLSRAFADSLMGWLGDRPKSALLWPGNWARYKEAGVMLQHDLKAAGIPYEVNGRYADFHALRKTFVTNLARSGVMPKVAQALARHSDINLTLMVYTDVEIGELMRAVERLDSILDKPKSS
jgi:site-specific recombinase XerD